MVIMIRILLALVATYLSIALAVGQTIINDKPSAVEEKILTLASIGLYPLN